MTTHKQHTPRDEIPARLGCTWEEVARIADRHTLAMQLWLPTRAPDAVCYVSRGIVAGSSGLGVPILNQALGADFPDQMSDTQIDAEIEGIRAFFARRSVPWYWWISPHSTPEDIDRHLARHGLRDRTSLPMMVAPLPRPSFPHHPDAHVWRARTRTDLQAASTIRRIAFRFVEGEALTYFEDMPDEWLGGGPARLYLARLGNGPPASIGALVMAQGLPGVYVMATLPEWQRRGLGKAVLARIMSDAAEDGHKLIVLTASDRGYGLYRQFGFEHIFDYSIYQLDETE